MTEEQKKQKDLISVIIPVYNAENTLSRCINSICNQKYHEIEIILVNDGSKDNSLNVCNQLAKKDDRIRVINKKNGGVSSARNMGINAANGMYIGFVDADDWIANNMYSDLYEHIKKNNSDVVLCNYIQVCGDIYVNRDEFININDESKTIKEEVLLNIIKRKENNIMGSCWRMLVPKQFLITNNIQFDNGIKMSEDMMFVIKCIDVAKNVSLERKQLYYYWISNDSITAKYISNIWEDMMVFTDWCNTNIVSKYFNFNLREGINECISNAVVVATSNACKKGTPMNFSQRISYSQKICTQPFVEEAIKTTWKSRKSFLKKTWPQILCIVFRCKWMVVLYHSIKHRTIFSTKTV